MPGLMERFPLVLANPYSQYPLEYYTKYNFLTVWIFSLKSGAIAWACGFPIG
jgi:hypothetical protein